MKRRGKSRPFELFVSHASADERFVERLCGELRRHGLRYWYSKRHIRGARQWHDAIGEALERCEWFLLVLSPKAITSRWVKRELMYAIETPRYDERIVPCLLKKCDASKLSWTLPSYQFVDFTAGFEQGVRELLRMWGIRYQPAATPVRKPRRNRKRQR